MEGAKKSVEPFHTRTRPIERVEEKPREGAVFFKKQIVFRDRGCVLRKSRCGLLGRDENKSSVTPLVFINYVFKNK